MNRDRSAKLLLCVNLNGRSGLSIEGVPVFRKGRCTPLSKTLAHGSGAWENSAMAGSGAVSGTLVIPGPGHEPPFPTGQDMHGSLNISSLGLG